MLLATAARAQEAAPRGQRDPVRLGVDVLERTGFEAVRNRRLGLITNHTGRNSLGERTVEVLRRAPGATLVALFSPEHGLQGRVDAVVQDGVDEATGLPVYSLYADKDRKPKPHQLKGIDTLVFDIQDIGTRFYTYISTMGLAMEAAAEARLRFVVLDRPNPIGGVKVEGPLADADKGSFVAYHTIPIRHGMTVGELARMFQRERQLRLDLTVVPLQNWDRSHHLDQAGVEWVHPSPNMRSLRAAILYPGIGVLEMTNLSVGRGTQTPFELVGAPWIEARRLAQELRHHSLPGVAIEPVWFKPTYSRFAGQECQGVRFVILDRERLEPVRLGLHVACALRKLYPEAWKMERLMTLLAAQEVHESIADGRTADTILASYRRELDEFQRRRSSYLMY